MSPSLKNNTFIPLKNVVNISCCPAGGDRDKQIKLGTLGLHHFLIMLLTINIGSILL
jgi:hypothetical protein